MKNTKKYFTISELAKEFDVKKSHIRFCEEKGLISPRTTPMKRRMYSRYDRTRLKLIFHCVVIGYSEDQIVELIGSPDVDLNEMDQIRKSLEYGEEKLDELVKRSRELKFHQRTSIRTEISMLHEYVEELKTITPATLAKPAAEPHVEDEERKEAAPKPVKTIKPEPAKKPERRPARMIPVYVAGLALILIVGGYFYYQDSKKETQTLDLAQKQQPKTETHSEYRDSVPSDDTGDRQNLVPQPIETPAPPLSIQQDSLTEESKELVEKEPSKDQAETAVLLSIADLEVVEKAALSSTKEAVPSVIEDEVLKEKPSVKESAPVGMEEEAKLTERAEAVATLKTGPSVGKTASATLPKPSDSPLKPKQPVDNKLSSVKETARVEKEDPVVQAETEISPSHAATTSKAQTTAPSKKAASVAQVEETRQPEPLAPAATVPKEAPLVSEEQEAVSPQNEPPSDAKVKEEPAVEKAVVEASPTAAGKDQLLATAPKTESSGAVEAVKPSIEIEKEKEFVASKGEIFDREEQGERLKSFLRIYCQTYENKDIDKFASFFAPDATENNRPFHELLPKYRKNMEMIESFNYRIELVVYYLQADTGNVEMQGKFFTRYLLHEGAWKENSGDISMELANSGDSYLVKRLNYSK